MDVSPDHEPTLTERGTDVHLYHPLTTRRGTHDSRPIRWESWTPHPSAPQRGGKGAHNQDGELTPIASSGPRHRGSTHGYTSWMCPNASECRYARMALPRPNEITLRLTETNASHTGSTVEDHVWFEDRWMVASLCDE
jgi:hypothetical protein